MFKLIPAGFSLLKMFKKAGKTGVVTAIATATVIDYNQSFWLGLATALLTAVVNYLNQVRKG